MRSMYTKTILSARTNDVMINRTDADVINVGLMLLKSISVPIEANSKGSKKSHTLFVAISTSSYDHKTLLLIYYCYNYTIVNLAPSV